MFVDEVQEILKIDDKNYPFTVTLLGGECAIASGVKTVILSTQNELKLKVKSGVLKIVGEDLSIRQIGGGDMYLSGEIKSVEIEKN